MGMKNIGTRGSVENNKLWMGGRLEYIYIYLYENGLM